MAGPRKIGDGTAAGLGASPLAMRPQWQLFKLTECSYRLGTSLSKLTLIAPT